MNLLLLFNFQYFKERALLGELYIFGQYSELLRMGGSLFLILSTSRLPIFYDSISLTEIKEQRQAILIVIPLFCQKPNLTNKIQKVVFQRVNKIVSKLIEQIKIEVIIFFKNYFNSFRAMSFAKES